MFKQNKILKKLLTNSKITGNINKLLENSNQEIKKSKKFLTDMKRCGNLIWLSKRTEKLEKINFQENEKSS